MYYRVKSVLRRLSEREQQTKLCIYSSKRSCRVDLHDVIAMAHTALIQITANFWPNKTNSLVLCTLHILH